MSRSVILAASVFKTTCKKADRTDTQSNDGNEKRLRVQRESSVTSYRLQLTSDPGISQFHFSNHVPSWCIGYFLQAGRLSYKTQPVRHKHWRISPKQTPPESVLYQSESVTQITRGNDSRQCRVFTAVCLSLHMISQKPMQLRSSNLTYKCSTMSPGNPYILELKIKGQGQESQKHCRRGSLHSCECSLLLVSTVQTLQVIHAR